MYKMAFAHGHDDHSGEGWYNIDTGMDGNAFTSRYFDANEDFYNGKLNKVLIGPQIAEVDTKVLLLKPAHR